jgi:hypothetical protein
MKRATLAVAVLLAATTTLSCGSDTTRPPPTPVPGRLTVSLITPAPDDGAVILRLQGPSISDVTGRAGLQVYWRSISDGEATAIVVSDVIANGTTMLTFAVPDVRDAAAYSVSVLDAASTANEPRASVNGYGASVAVVPTGLDR